MTGGELHAATPAEVAEQLRTTERWVREQCPVSESIANDLRESNARIVSSETSGLPKNWATMSARARRRYLKRRRSS